MEENSNLRQTATYMEDLAKGIGVCVMENLILEGLQLIELKHGFIRCDFVPPICAPDEDGNWHVGAIETTIDAVGPLAAYTASGKPHVSVDFTVSYFSKATIQEKVEIEAKIVDTNKYLRSAMVKVGKKEEKGLVALGRLWMVPTRTKLKEKSTQSSKL